MQHTEEGGYAYEHNTCSSCLQPSSAPVKEFSPIPLTDILNISLRHLDGASDLRSISLRAPSIEAGSGCFPGLVQQSQKTSVPSSTVDPLNKYYLFIQVFEEKTQHTISGISVWECMWQLYQEY